MKYGLDDKPAPAAFLLYGLQWWVVSLPCVVIMGVVVSRLHFSDPGSQVFYLQKLFGLTGLATLAQVLLGHRLPLVVGPAAILLVGITASIASGILALYTSIMIGGAALALVAGLGLLSRLRTFFTPRVVSVILLLVAISLSPTILTMTLETGSAPAFHLAFTLGLVLLMVVANQVLPGVWKSMTVLFGLAGGSLIYFLALGWPEAAGYAAPAGPVSIFLPGLDFEAGTIAAFLICMVALTINELGSIESIGQILKVGDIKGRVRRGVLVCGLANLASGAAGVIGPVSFSLSAGLISATRCAARLTMVPAAIGLVLCAFSPELVLVFSHIPGAVMGALLLYLMASQLASGLGLLVSGRCVSDFTEGLTVGLPVMVTLLIAFSPPQVFAGVPQLIRPVVATALSWALFWCCSWSTFCSEKNRTGRMVNGLPLKLS